MKLVYATDLEGREDFYKALLEHAWRTRLDAVVIGGGMFPHGGAGGGFGEHDDAASDISYQQGFVEVFLAPLLRQFRRIAPRTRVLLLPGAGDWRASAATLEPLFDEGLALDLDGQRVEAPGGWELIGCGLVVADGGPIADRQRRDRRDDAPPTRAEPAFHSERGPCDLPGHLASRPSLAEVLDALPTPAVPARTIYVTHEAPHGTHADVRADGSHGGSYALRALLERVAPRAALVGRHHAAPYKTSTPYDRLGSTVICNPGQGQLSLHRVEFDLADPRGASSHSVFGTEFPFTGGEIAIGPGS